MSSSAGRIQRQATTADGKSRSSRNNLGGRVVDELCCVVQFTESLHDVGSGLATRFKFRAQPPSDHHNARHTTITNSVEVLLLRGSKSHLDEKTHVTIHSFIPSFTLITRFLPRPVTRKTLMNSVLTCRSRSLCFDILVCCFKSPRTC